MDFPTSRLLHPYNHDYRLYHDYAKKFRLKETCIQHAKLQGDGGQKPCLTVASFPGPHAKRGSGPGDT